MCARLQQKTYWCVQNTNNKSGAFSRPLKQAYRPYQQSSWHVQNTNTDSGTFTKPRKQPFRWVKKNNHGTGAFTRPHRDQSWCMESTNADTDVFTSPHLQLSWCIQSTNQNSGAFTTSVISIDYVWVTKRKLVIYADIWRCHTNSDWRLVRIIYHNINPFSAGIDFRHHNLTSIDVRLWRLESILALKESNIYNDRRLIT